MKEHLVVRDLLALAAAGALAPVEQRRVEEHLQRCESCSAEFSEWLSLAGALKQLPIPMAPPKLVLKTQSLLSHAALKGRPASRIGLALLVLFSWMVTFTTVKFVQLFDIPVSQWLEVSSTTLWVAYIGATWFATALAAGLLGKHWRQEGRTI
jgi:predicted anti-sigma-YlaC factor YlaD